MQLALAFGTTLVPIAAALTEIIKRTVSVPNNLLPIVSLAIGLLVGAAAYPFTDMDLIMRLWAGGIAGFAASGLYETFFSKRGGTSDGKLGNS